MADEQGDLPEDAGDEVLGPLSFAVEVGGARLDAFLIERLREQGRSRAEVQAWIAEGRVGVVRGAAHAGDEPPRVLKPAQRLRAGDAVVVQPPPPAAPPGPLEPEELPLPLLFQDEALLVVDKPAGLTVHPGAGQRSGTLANALLALSPGRLSGLGGPERPGIVHRLDKDTSGVLVVARSDRAHRHLARQFHDRTVEKRYVAIVCGQPREDAGFVDLPLGRHPKDRKRMAVVEGGRAARTRWRVLERFAAHAFLELAPETGRTHQLRVHLKAIGHPIVADATYSRSDRLCAGEVGAAGPAEAVLIARQALHAARLVITHPEGGERLSFAAPLPADIARALAALRGSDPGPGW